MKKSECTYIGRILKPHGVKGELSVKFESSLFSDFIEQLEVAKNNQKFLFLEVYQNDELVPFFIEWAGDSGNGFGRIKFEDYDSVESVAELVNKGLFILTDNIEKKNIETIREHELIGFSVTDKKSKIIGTVKAILENQKQPMFLIKNGEKEILIPMVDEFILKVEMKKRIIKMDIPEGLIDLNL